MTTSAITVVKAGSKVEIGSALFRFTGDESPVLSTWTAIATGATAYLAATPSGSAGNQILTINWTDTAPVWDTAKQSWYTSVGSVIRHIASVYKAGTSSYERKDILNPLNTAVQFGDYTTGGNLAWREASGYIVASKWIKHVVNTYESITATQDAVFDALKAYIPTTSESVILSGGASLSAQADLFVAAYAIRINATLIRLYGAAASNTAGRAEPYLTCTDGNTAQAPVMTPGSLAYGYVTISW